MDSKHVIDNKCKAFALHIISLCRELSNNKVDYVIAKQLLRSGTSIGANVRERLNAQSRLDFTSKLMIALKETDESAYWLELLFESGIIDDKTYTPLHGELKQIIAIITASINKLKGNDTLNM